MPCRRATSDNVASPMPISPMIARFCVTLQLRRVEAMTSNRGVVLSPAPDPLVERRAIRGRRARRPWPEAYDRASGEGAAPTIDRGLTTLLGRAVAARLAVLSAEDASLAALAQRLGMKRDQLTGLVRVSTLAPAIVEAILEGRQPLGLSARWLMRMSHALPLDWTAQRKFLGFAAV